jgi:hypothetical protein
MKISEERFSVMGRIDAHKEDMMEQGTSQRRNSAMETNGRSKDPPK